MGKKRSTNPKATRLLEKKRRDSTSPTNPKRGPREGQGTEKGNTKRIAWGGGKGASSRWL